jgi:hypothetical protein
MEDATTSPCRPRHCRRSGRGDQLWSVERMHAHASWAAPVSWADLAGCSPGRGPKADLFTVHILSNFYISFAFKFLEICMEFQNS